MLANDRTATALCDKVACCVNASAYDSANYLCASVKSNESLENNRIDPPLSASSEVAAVKCTEAFDISPPYKTHTKTISKSKAT